MTIERDEHLLGEGLRLSTDLQHPTSEQDVTRRQGEVFTVEDEGTLDENQVEPWQRNVQQNHLCGLVCERERESARRRRSRKESQDEREGAEKYAHAHET